LLTNGQNIVKIDEGVLEPPSV